MDRSVFVLRLMLVAVLAVAVLVRLAFLLPSYWAHPYEVHHQDEHFLPLEAVALWEGVTPDELGWPASPSRLLLSAAYLGLLVTETAPALLAQGASLTDRM